MQTPILALTRRRQGANAGVLIATAAGRNMRLLVQLRWIAVAGQLLAILAVHFGLGVSLPLASMLAVVLVLAFANHYARRQLYSRPIGQNAILMALLFDAAALTVQLHLSGGVGNPFTYLFLLQLVLGAILLDGRRVAVLLTAVILAYAALAVASPLLIYPVALAWAVPWLDLIGAWVSFVLTGALLVVFVTRVMSNLGVRDAQLAELNQAAAEEDGIVRLGLLASGAAHELGTPLSSLSVILNDWSRMPRITGDPELALELAEMQAALDRCKTVVGDILHSAGAPRGEALALIDASDFLAAIAAAWRADHPSPPMEVVIGGLDGARVADEPAARQVIASLLDNAAEASPGGLALSARRVGANLEVSVIDRGPGFPPDRLAQIGKPYQSSKGAGRGLGLFLAAALARRVGGRLIAENRAEGGACVRLVLPLANIEDEAR